MLERGGSRAGAGTRPSARLKPRLALASTLNSLIRPWIGAGLRLAALSLATAAGLAAAQAAAGDGRPTATTAATTAAASAPSPTRLIMAATAASAPGIAPHLAAVPALEARVLSIANELRCLVCQNETIAASHADLAVDLRRQIRLQLAEGRSERQILDYMVERYGDFVLYRPPLKTSTVLLWAGPFALLLLGAAVAAFHIRRRRRAVATLELSPAEAQRARSLLEPAADGPIHGPTAGLPEGRSQGQPTR